MNTFPIGIQVNAPVNPSKGEVRYNADTFTMEVFTGDKWTAFHNSHWNEEWEFLCKALQSRGWRRFILSRLQDNKHAIDIGYWLKENCQGAYERNGRDFMFESEKDYTLFVLRWGS